MLLTWLYKLLTKLSILESSYDQINCSAVSFSFSSLLGENFL